MEDYRLVVYREVGSIQEELLLGQGQVFYLFSFLVVWFYNLVFNKGFCSWKKVNDYIPTVRLVSFKHHFIFPYLKKLRANLAKALSLRWFKKKVEELVEQENPNASLVPSAHYKNILFCLHTSHQQADKQNWSHMHFNPGYVNQ
jgi:hypothetical protein